jgi:cytochrome c-type biogenesis protein CcsB
MSSKVMDTTLGQVKPAGRKEPVGVLRFLPFALPLVLGGGFVLAQWTGAISELSSESGLVILALISYISASVLFWLYLYQREALLENRAVLTAALGFGLNIAAWGTRGLVVNHYPLSNLYDTALSLGMTTAGAGLVAVAVYRHRFIGALTVPVSTMFLILALLYGSQVIDLPPVLVSYWRPIHVSIAMTGYGVCAASFATGLMYLLKDGLKVEWLGVCTMLFVVPVYALMSGGSILHGSFEIPLMINGQRIPMDADGTEFLRATIPFVGLLFQVALVVSVATTICFAGHLYFSTGSVSDRFKSGTVGHWLARASLLLQAVGLGWLIYQVKASTPGAHLITEAQRAAVQPAFLEQFGSQLQMELRGSGVEIACAITAAGLTAFVVLFHWKLGRVLNALPSLDVLDNLTYKAVTVALPLLVMMLITGAVWANESWGRYWGWDPKETWALITTLVYAIFLHTRIVHGWKGRRTAMFAVLGFISVIFTYLGVSFILPGLHSYAKL